MYKYWIFVENKPINGGLYAEFDCAMKYARGLLLKSKLSSNVHIEKYDMTKSEKQNIIDMDDRSKILVETIIVTR